MKNILYETSSTFCCQSFTKPQSSCAVNHHIKSTWCYNYGVSDLKTAGRCFYVLTFLVGNFYWAQSAFHPGPYIIIPWSVMIWDSMMLRSKLAGFIIILILIVSISILASNTHTHIIFSWFLKINYPHYSWMALIVPRRRQVGKIKVIKHGFEKNCYEKFLSPQVITQSGNIS